jgi:hypothetical protein
MRDIFKTIRENTGAIVTATIVLLLVLNYLLNVIPANERKLDDENRNNLAEFQEHFNYILHDYANYIDRKSFRQIFVDDQLVTHNERLKDYYDAVVVERISIKDIKDYPFGNCFILKRRIDYKFDQKQIVSNLDTTRRSDTNYVPIDKLELSDKLRGSIPFPYWMIYRIIPDRKDSTKMEAEILLANDIDRQEMDSLTKHAQVKGYNSLSYSGRRYYRKNFTPEGTNFNMVLTVAVDEDDFDKLARQADVSRTIICIVAVILLFLIIPLLKPLISSSREKLMQSDLIASTTSICICTMLLAVVIFSFYFSNISKERSVSRMTEMGNNVQLQFRQGIDSCKEEFDLVIHQLNLKKGPVHFSFDSLEVKKEKKTELTDQVTYHAELKKNDSIRHRLDSLKTSNGKNNMFVDQIAHRPDLIKKDTIYYCLDSPEVKKAKKLEFVFEMDSDFFMTRDVSLHADLTPRNNYGDRDYAKQLRSPLYQSALSAVYSKSDNKFKLVYIQKSKSGFEGFDYVPKIKWPDSNADYGYMICNSEGRVLLHSDSTKRLRENIINICPGSISLTKIFHGHQGDFFEMNYHNELCLFNGRRLIYNDTPGRSNAQIYLLVYKKLDFDNSLIIYSVVKGFIISVAFGLLTCLLLLCYSVFFYIGHLSVFSKVHVYWLFPDESRRHEFRFIIYLNAVFCILAMVTFFIFPAQAMFLSMIAGLNVAFICFLLLTQRTFVFNEASPERKVFTRLLAVIMTGCITIAAILYYNDYPIFAFFNFVGGHILFLAILRRKTITAHYPANIKPSPHYCYHGFLSSIICYHYILVPAIIVFSIFSNETRRAEDCINSLEENPVVGSVSEKAIYQNEELFNSIHFLDAPFYKVLRQNMFDFYFPMPESNTQVAYYLVTDETYKIVCLVCGVLLLGLAVFCVVRFYTGRFFFFELSAFYRNNKALNRQRLTNMHTILPPFSNSDLRLLEEGEIGRANVPANYRFASEIDNNEATQFKKLELIYNKALEVHNDEYAWLWKRLSDDEKFVLHDFSADFFVNYKNKKHLVKLIEKGIIVADPVTGRLRLMNNGFRAFVMYYEKIDPDFSADEIEKSIRGTYAKWKIPLAIIALSFLLLMMYLYREKYDKVLVIGGSVISTMGFIIRFLNTYKK